MKTKILNGFKAVTGKIFAWIKKISLKKKNKIEEIIALVLLLFFSITTSNAQFVEADYCIGGTQYEHVEKIHHTADGGFLLFISSTSTDGDFAGNPGGGCYLVIKFSGQHVIEWQTLIPSVTGSLLNMIEYDQSYYFTSMGGNTNLDTLYYHIGSIDHSGNILWKNTYQSIQYSNVNAYYLFSEFPNTNQLSLDSLTGNLYFNFNDKMTQHIIKLDPSGNLIWQNQQDLSIYSTCDDSICPIGTKLIPLANDEVIAITRIGDLNYPNYPVFTYDQVIAKYNNTGDLINLNDTCSTLIDFESNIIDHEPDSLIIVNNQFLYKICKTNLSVTSYILPYTTATRHQSILYLQTTDKPGWIVCAYQVLDTILGTWVKYHSIGNYRTGNFHSTIIDSFQSSLLLTYYEPDNSYIFLSNGYSGDSGEFYITKCLENGTIIYRRKIHSGHIAPFFYWENPILYKEVSGNLLFLVFMTSSGFSTDQFLKIINLENGTVTGNFDNLYYYDPVNPYIPVGYYYLHQTAENKIFTISEAQCKPDDYDVKLSQVLLNSNRIYGRSFIDYNENQEKDGNDIYYGQAYFTATNNARTFSTYLSANDYAVSYTDTGTWISRIKPFTDYFTVHPTEFTTSHSDYTHFDTVIFALRPIANIKDLKISLVNSFITRLGGEAHYTIHFTNAGTYPASGTVKLLPDPRTTFIQALPEISTETNDTLSWNFTDLAVGETRMIEVKVLANIPPQLNMGDTLYHIAWIEPVANDTQPADNTAILEEVIRASYDPNDKLTTSGKDITPTQIANDEYITYVIRFQNTGNDTAFRIVLEDTLDSKLDWSSLEPAGSSHPFTMQVTNGNIIHFTFNTLQLPPASIDEAKSHGYVAYKIKVKKDVSEGYTIKNTAHIYFDFNAPITTHTVNTRVITLTAIHSQNIHTNAIKIYPNPNKGQFTLQLNIPYTSSNIQLIDMTGKAVYQKELSGNEASIDIRGLAAGMYSIQVKTGKEIFIQKIIIE